jgi:LysR family transcriptional regulator, hydrogen peroxide-inducible genes activator
MTLTQLEYIVAVANELHFAKAAAQCYVTQPTLSMQIQKLEEEIGIKIFDRNKQPVLPTEAGVELIAQARKILAERDAFRDIIQVQKGVLQGQLTVGVIPTLAPYLLPLFVTDFTQRYPGVKLVVSELTTGVIVRRLREGRLDAGLLVTPLSETSIQEEPLFYEELLAYVSKNNAAFKKSYVLTKDIDPNKLWLLEEGHCFRSQIINLCALRKSSREGSHFEYEAGSIETLRRMVDLGDGITIIPELATLDMTPKQLNHLRYFKAPSPMREVSLVTHRNYVKHRLLKALKETIINSVPDKIKGNKKKNIVPVA